MRTIAHISDLHFDRVDPAVAEGLVADLAGRSPSLLVASGDFTQRATAEQFAQAAAYLRRLPAPQLIVPGNHDISMYDVLRRFIFPLRRYEEYLTRDLSPVYQDREMLVIGINTARSFTRISGWISDRQLAAVKRVACDARPGIVKVVVTHHPFIPSPRDPSADVVRRGASALDQLEQCGIDLLLAGHLHLAYHDDIRSHHKALKRSVLSVQAGTAISTRTRGEPNAYNWITVAPDLVVVEVRVWNGQSFEESLVTRYERVENVWRRQLQIPIDEPAAAALHMPQGAVQSAEAVQAPGRPNKPT